MSALTESFRSCIRALPGGLLVTPDSGIPDGRCSGNGSRYSPNKVLDRTAIHDRTGIMFTQDPTHFTTSLPDIAAHLAV